jgi:hypothetical protein
VLYKNARKIRQQILSQDRNIYLIFRNFLKENIGLYIDQHLFMLIFNVATRFEFSQMEVFSVKFYFMRINLDTPGVTSVFIRSREKGRISTQFINPKTQCTPLVKFGYHPVYRKHTDGLGFSFAYEGGKDERFACSHLIGCHLWHQITMSSGTYLHIFEERPGKPWNLPGGKYEEGDRTPLDTLQRELEEEEVDYGDIKDTNISRGTEAISILFNACWECDKPSGWLNIDNNTVYSAPIEFGGEEIDVELAGYMWGFCEVSGYKRLIFKIHSLTWENWVKVKFVSCH